MPAKQDKRAKVVTFGEVMMRLSTPGYARFSQANSFQIHFGGAEANVAVSLASFGLPSEHVSALPDNDIGFACKNYLARNGVSTQHIVHSNDRMGLYFLEGGAMQRSSKIIYDRFDSAFANLKPGQFDWNRILDGASCFHYTGITPALSSRAADECREAVSTAFDLGVKISGDINYRRNLWQYGKSPIDVMPQLLSKTHLIVAAESDLQNCAGIVADNFNEACMQAFDQFPNLELIATTERTSISASHNKIAGCLVNRTASIRSREYDLAHIVDRIGSGDAFISGLLFALNDHRSYHEALDFAVAACALKHSIEGDANISSVSEVENLLRGVHVGQLMR